MLLSHGVDMAEGVAPPTLINHLRHGLHGTGSNPHCDGMLLVGAARRVKVLALGVAPAAPVVG